MKARILKVFVVLLALTMLSMATGCAKKKVGPDADINAAAEAEAAAAAAAAAEAERLREETLKQDFQQGVQDLSQRIQFDYDSYELSPEAREILQQKAQVLKQFPRMTVVVEGYCDDRGTEEYNLALGERRARAAYEFLVLLGIGPERLSFVSYGEENPLDPADNEQAWATNRRDEFRVSY